MDDDGIANYSELTLPEGYELVVTGDFFVIPGKSYTVELKKIPESTIINVTFKDEAGNVLGGGDYFVDEDGDGIANYSELDLPVGYELIVTGDFFVENGAHYDITLKMRETVLTVTFEDVDGNVIDKVTWKQVFRDHRMIHTYSLLVKHSSFRKDTSLQRVLIRLQISRFRMVQ